MNWYETIKEFHDKKLWNLTQVKNGVVKNKITREEYKKITNEDYAE
ncbi:XkdX family protein [Romboutsia lituseburensis]|nr:XkdX family protein [Romboutsia lituseburensis]MCR8744330.1 XkdX family protein [Romboutsia lituseburensis]